MLKALFGPKTFLDPDLEDWVIDSFGWLMTHLGGASALAQTPLVTPSRDYFPPTDTVGHARALHVFDTIRQFRGISNWHCRLIPVERDERHRALSQTLGVEFKGAGAGGTFSASDGEVLIHYGADLVDRPAHLIAVLAHELSHYLLATVDAERPGGEEAEELLTDLTVAYAGFGIFGANAAFDFESDNTGWAWSRNGYLSERTWAFALAIFMVLSGKDEDPARYLKAGVGKLYEDARRYLAKNPTRLKALRG